MRPTIELIAALFDEVDEDYLVPFDWNPNTKLPNHGRTYRLKDRFRIKFKKMICIYDDMEDCRVAFMGIFYDNLKYVYQCQDLINKIKKITNPEMYISTHENNSSGLRSDHSVSNSTSNNNAISFDDDMKGSIGGSGEAAVQNAHFSAKFEAIEVKGVLDKKEDAIMQILDPNLRSISQGYDRNKGISANVSGGSSSTTGSNVSGYKNQSTHVQKMEAALELSALSAGIPKLTHQFLECFNALFYY